MIFGAGLGTRMRPITNHTPKPLVEVNGKPMIDYTLEKLAEYGVERVVVNTYHLAEKLEAHLQKYQLPVASCQLPEIITIRETTLLETGGGLVNALPLLGAEGPFFVINGDVIWKDGEEPALLRLQKAYDPEKMDALLLLIKREEAHGYEGDGDFYLEKVNTCSPLEGEQARSFQEKDRAVGGQEKRNAPPRFAESDAFHSSAPPPGGSMTILRGHPPRPYVFSGIQIFHPRLLEGYSATPFSLSEIYRKNLLHGLTHAGKWWHIGTPKSLKNKFQTKLT